MVANGGGGGQRGRATFSLTAVRPSLSIRVPENATPKRFNYRKFTFDHYDPLCAHCGFGIPTVLEVVQIDGNRANNEIANLVILCRLAGREEGIVVVPLS